MLLTTSGQRTTLRNDIIAKSTAGQPLQAAVASGDWDAIAQYYNTVAAFTVWKTSVMVSEIGDAIVATALNSTTALQLQRLQAVCGELSGGVINPSKADRRSIFDLIFSGTGPEATTRAQLLVLWKRLARNIEKLLANTTGGNGADATPALLVVEGSIGAQELSDVYFQIVT